jgi:hypothetical protein
MQKPGLPKQRTYARLHSRHSWLVLDHSRGAREWSWKSHPSPETGGSELTTDETANDSVGPQPAREELDNGRTERLLSYLLAGKNLREICELERISRGTVWRIRTSPDFERRFAEAKSEMLGAAIAQLHSSATQFVSTLAAVAGDAAARPGERVQASREGLAALYRGVELFDVIRRLEKLEAVAEEGQKQ